VHDVTTSVQDELCWLDVASLPLPGSAHSLAVCVLESPGDRKPELMLLDRLAGLVECVRRERDDRDVVLLELPQMLLKVG
jgi:hypothetical protein